jgi:hypothetical protein
VCYDVIRRRQLPIALVGFDNSLQAQQMGITSYDFSAQAVTAAALAYTLHFRGPRRPADGPAVDEIEGFVVERESTTGYRPTAKNPKSR